DHFTEKFNDAVYQSYKFTQANSNFKTSAKNHIVSILSSYYKGQKGLTRLRRQLGLSERRSDHYKHCKAVLETEKPDFLFCTSQRAVTSISPVEAAKELNIPTGAFIFS